MNIDDKIKFFRSIEKFVKNFEIFKHSKYYGYFKAKVGEDIENIEGIHSVAIDITENQNYERLKFFIIYGESLQREIKDFQKEFNKYGVGMFLWVCEKYCALIKVIEMYIKDKKLPYIPIFKGSREALEDYLKFIEDVKKKNEILLNQEINMSKELFFHKTARPINMLREKDPFMNFVIKKINKNYTLLLDDFKAKTDKFMPDLIHNLEEYTKLTIPIFNELAQQTTSDDIISSKNGNKLRKALQEQIDIVNAKNNPILELFEQEVGSERNEEIKQEINELLKKYNEVCKQEEISLIREYIILVKDIDSYNIEFAKFIRRLHHIKTKNNRDYLRDKKCFYLIDKYDRNARNKLKGFIASQLKIHYPNLAKFILCFFEYNFLRKLEAHEIPIDIQLSKDKKKAFIPQKGNKKDAELDIKEIKKIKNTYGFFIEATRICEQ